MAYTVKKLAGLSGVSIRTLHFYDEIGLLAPAYLGDQGYRYYEEEQLLTLQQILFFRELGFELKEIHKILKQGDFDKVTALKAHRKVLLQKRDRIGQLIDTVDKTMKRIKGEKEMNDKEIYKGFSPEKQASYEQYLVNLYGDRVKKHIAEAKANSATWSKDKNEQVSSDWDAICKDLAEAMAAKKSVDSVLVQAIITRHYEWIKQFWQPDHESYIGLGLGYAAFEWKQAFEKVDDHHPKLAEFMAAGMKVFADQQLK